MTDIFASLSPLHMLAGLAMLCASGMLRGFSGYGFAVAAVPLLSLFMPPTAAVSIVLILQLFISTNNVKETVRLADWRTVKVLVAAAALTTPIGLLLLTRLPDDVTRLCIAAIVVGTVAVLAVGRRSDQAFTPSKGVTALYGVMSGLSNGLAGMSGPPVIAYFLATRVPKERARASMITVFTLSGVCALVPLLIAGEVTLDMAALALVAVPLVWLSTSLGRRLFLVSSEAVYRWSGLIFLGLTALVLVLKVLWPGE
ncbi:MAG TPA: sulfite exporter TauE/SafE family protein [Alphaproteobacteria bacterium]|jgi:hypothetical protein